MTDLDREAREAAKAHRVDMERHYYTDNERCTKQISYELGYLAAAETREKRIAELRTSLMVTGANFDSAVKEIATLRARVAELEAQLDRTKLPLWILREEVPVEEIAAVLDWELGLDYPDTEAISLWLATVKG